MSQIKQKTYSYEEYYKLDDDKRYELFDGELELAPAPFTDHQLLLLKLTRILADFVDDNQLGKILFAPVDVILDDKNVVQPDLIFISNKNENILKKRGVFGSPDMVVEVLSEFNQSRDRKKKLELYERFQIKEYWIVDPGKKMIELYHLEARKYKFASLKEKDTFSSLIVQGFHLSLSDLFSL